jgi:3-hydroxyisobutyrate dehydrogenase
MMIASGTEKTERQKKDYAMNKGFIGLGHLGKAIATRLMACGHEIAVYNRSPEKAQGMAATIADSPGSLARYSDVIFLCLSDSPAVFQIFEAGDGLLSTGLTDKVIVDFSTHQTSAVEKLYALCHDHGALYLESPVLGSVVPALQGNLTLVAGGDAMAYARVKPLLSDLASTVFFLEKPGQATRIKLMNNMILASLMISLSEALALGEASGMDKQTVLDILGKGAGGSVILDAKKNKLLEEDFSAHFSSALLYKDLNCARDMARDMGRHLFTADFAETQYARIFEKGLEHTDFSGIYTIYKE